MASKLAKMQKQKASSTPQTRASPPAKPPRANRIPSVEALLDSHTALQPPISIEGMLEAAPVTAAAKAASDAASSLVAAQASSSASIQLAPQTIPSANMHTPAPPNVGAAPEILAYLQSMQQQLNELKSTQQTAVRLTDRTGALNPAAADPSNPGNPPPRTQARLGGNGLGVGLAMSMPLYHKVLTKLKKENKVALAAHFFRKTTNQGRKPDDSNPLHLLADAVRERNEDSAQTLGGVDFRISLPSPRRVPNLTP